MTKQTLLAGILCAGTTVLLWGAPPSAAAEESASFRLYHETPNYAERGPGSSSSYQMNEDGVTWLAAPLVGSSFQIVTAPPAALEEEEAPPAGEERPPSGHYRGKGTILADILARYKAGEGPVFVHVEEEGEEPDKAAAPTQPTAEPFPGVDFGIPKAKPIYKVAVYYPRGEMLLGPLHYFYTTDEPQRVEAPLPQAGLSREVFRLIEVMFMNQHRLLLTQAVAALAFLLAFQVFLLRVPRAAYAPARRGRLRLWFLLLPIIGKRQEGEEKEGKRRRRTQTTRHAFQRRKI